MDVIHISEFWKLKYVHVSTHTFSVFIVTALAEESKNEISHCQHCFSLLGVSNLIKTDNGTAISVKHLRHFVDN